MGRLGNQIIESSAANAVLPSRTGTVGDVKTSQGLEQIAGRVGLSSEAAKLRGRIGEKPKELFSGGFVSDIFDTLNASQYGVVGLIKGKGFFEGVKTRQSFSDQDALGQYGLPGVIAGIVLDIAVDPLTYIAPITIFKKIGAITKLGKPVASAARAFMNTRAGQQLGRSFIYRFGQAPEYAAIAERSTKNIAVGQQNMMEIVRPLTKLDPKIQRIVLTARKAGKLHELPPSILLKAKPAFDELDRLGKEAVELGLLKKEIYEQNVGQYVARLYRKHEVPEDVVGRIKTFFDRRPIRIDTQRFKHRKDISEDVREAMGEILEAGYPTAKSLVQLTQAVERGKFFRDVAVKFSKDAIDDVVTKGDFLSGFARLPDTPRLGALSGKYVPRPIFDDIQEIVRVKTPTQQRLNNIVAGFKFGKVVMNPASHARNVMSNFILNNFEGLSPARLDIYGEAAKELATKGRWYQEARKVGLGLDNFAAQEIKGFLTGPETSKISKGIRGFFDKISDIYGKEEEFAKLAQYIFQRKRGLSPDAAWKVAERATFNYAQVTPFIRRIRESIFGYPFITFTYKVTPQVARVALTKPTKISNIGKLKQAIENLSPQKDLESERATEPAYIKNGFFIRMPMKDKYGRNLYFDATYILPFGDIFSGKFITAEKEGTTVSQSAFSKLPFFNIVSELAQNKDFFGNDIIKKDSLEPWQQGADLMKYLVKQYGPPLATDFPGRLKRSIEFDITGKETPLEKQKRSTRTVTEELSRALLGLKVTPFDVERERQKREFELRNRLQDLLVGAGVLKEFEVPYIPKETKRNIGSGRLPR